MSSYSNHKQTFHIQHPTSLSNQNQSTAYGLFADELESTVSSNLSGNQTNNIVVQTKQSWNKSNNRKSQRRSESIKQVKKPIYERNPFTESLGESSIQDLEQQMFNKKFMPVRITIRQVHEMCRQFGVKRFGKNERMITSYTEMVDKMFKSDEMRCSIDFISKLESSLFCYILKDFTCLTHVMLHSDQCGPKELQRLEDSYKRGNKKATIFDFMHKFENNPKAQAMMNNLLDQSFNQNTGGGNTSVSFSINNTTNVNSSGGDVQSKSSEKKCSQNYKINTLILPGVLKNIAVSKNLKVLHFVHYKFNSQCWEDIGVAVGNSKTMKTFACNACNLHSLNHLEMLMKGLLSNNSIEKLDLSDNQIGDQESIYIVRFMKQQGEKRENTLWMTGLRHSDYDSKPYQNPSEENQMSNLVMQPNSPYKNIQMIQSRYFQKKDRIKNRKGLREVILKRNYLGSFFMENLQKCLRYDRFIKMVDLQGNRFQQQDIKQLIKFSLRENTSLVSIDVQNNPGCTEKYKKQIALCLLKNIEMMKRDGIELKEEWFRPEVLTFKIPNRILEGLGINVIIKKKQSLNHTYNGSMSNSHSGSPATGRIRQKSVNNSSMHKKIISKSRNDFPKQQPTDESQHNQDLLNLKIVVKKSQRSIKSSTRHAVDHNFINKNQNQINFRDQSQNNRSSAKRSSSNKKFSNQILYQKLYQNQQSTEKKPPLDKSAKKKIISRIPQDEKQSAQKVIYNKSNSYSDFQVSNMNKSSKKIDFSIVEQKIEPVEIFTNISECDLRDANVQQDRKVTSSMDKHKMSMKNQSESCANCKNYEKQYFQAEAKIMKQQDNYVKAQKEFDQKVQELSDQVMENQSLLPQSEDDIDVIRQIIEQQPQRIIQRIDNIFTELTFLMDAVQFQELDPRIKVILQQHIEQLMQISEEKNIFDNIGQQSLESQEVKLDKQKLSQNSKNNPISQQLENNNMKNNQNILSNSTYQNLNVTSISKDKSLIQSHGNIYSPNQNKMVVQSHFSDNTQRSEQPVEDLDSVQLMAMRLNKLQMQQSANSKSSKYDKKVNKTQAELYKQSSNQIKKLDDYEEYPHPYTLDDQNDLSFNERSQSNSGNNDDIEELNSEDNVFNQNNLQKKADLSAQKNKQQQNLQQQHQQKKYPNQQQNHLQQQYYKQSQNMNNEDIEDLYYDEDEDAIQNY
ncbi:UNKNOWN [Stylonychia lemnae]|uniref:Leucine Rich Repeat family protein n=1 Tax=Stylonychia lemnae TaxID=5949 RepID=A0A078B429_STYLE|nr:UNKNOWN [Stylonychia lemnae]|eukprot:CDW87947.1 UNKNOWN [Stylonychia lemnae]